MVYQLVVISVDATGAHIFRFYDNIVSLSSGVPRLNALRWNDARQGWAYPQQSACAENSKTISSPMYPSHHPKTKVSETKNKKTLLFILIEAKTKTLSFGLWREGFFFLSFFFFLRKKRLIFKTQSMVAVKLAWKKLIVIWKQDTNPLNVLCFSSNSLGTFPHVGGRFWRVL